jgi:hypothetical protein
MERLKKINQLHTHAHMEIQLIYYPKGKGERTNTFNRTSTQHAKGKGVSQAHKPFALNHQNRTQKTEHRFDTPPRI